MKGNQGFDRPYPDTLAHTCSNGDGTLDLLLQREEGISTMLEWVHNY